MSKLAPRRYGDRLLHAGDQENPVRLLHGQVSFDQLTAVQLDALEQFTRALIEAQPVTKNDVV